VKPETRGIDTSKSSEPNLSAVKLAAHRLALAARAFCAAKSDTEEYVAGQDLLRAAVTYARYVFDKSIPPP
jgi:hypothetical protein